MNHFSRAFKVERKPLISEEWEATKPIKYQQNQNQNPVMLILGGKNIDSGELTRKVDVLTSKGICNFPYGYPPILPSARIGHSVAVSRKNGQVFLCGGYDPTNLRKPGGLSIIGQKQTAGWSEHTPQFKKKILI